MKLRSIIFTSATLCCFTCFSQDDLASLVDSEVKPTEKEKVIATFKTTRLINLTTNEQVKRGELDFRIAHRFGDLAGSAGGASTFFGFDNVSDIRFSFDYGITDKWAIGIGRSKGAGAIGQIFDLNTKYKIIEQETNGIPIGISAQGIASFTSMSSTSSPSDITYFDNSFAHRWRYFGQILFVRKFSNEFSFILAPSVLHRNLVKLGDNNTHFALAAGMRFKISKRAAIIADYYQVINTSNYQESIGFQMPIGLGFELETGGHVFHALISSNRGLLENQFLAENTADPGLGQIRLGFNISRIFNILKVKEPNN